MKKLILLLVIVCTTMVSFANPTPAVNEKVLKVFQTVFPAIEDARWYEYDNHYEVYFESNDMKCRIKYDLEGKVLSTLRYYDEKMLSPYLKAKLSQKFAGKKVFGVTEVNSESELTYNIVLEDDKNWIHVQSDATGQMTVTDKFKKA